MEESVSVVHNIRNIGVMESHNRMAKSMSESHNIPENQGVLGVSLTRNIVCTYKTSILLS